MGEAALSPIPDGLGGLVMVSEIDGHRVSIALARRDDQLEAILRDGDQEFRSRADLLTDQNVPTLDTLIGPLITQWREANAKPDIWEIMRGGA